MSIDAYSVVAIFLALIEVGLGVLALRIAARDRRLSDPATREARRPQFVLTIGTLIAVAALSIPLLYLLRASWVPRWPGVMCVEGVRRIGMGSIGPAGWLPGLVAALDVIKPILLFLAGAWLVLRRASDLRIERVARAAVIAIGLLALTDGLAQFAYVAIPKEEVAPVGGCCMTSGLAANREAGLTATGGAITASTWANSAFIAAAALLGLGAVAIRAPSRTSVVGAALMALLAAASVRLAVSFFADVAAPKLLDQPFHHCAWCAFARAPETMIGAALYLSAVLASGWALVARLTATKSPGEGEPATARSLLVASSFGFLSAAAMSLVIAWQL